MATANILDGREVSQQLIEAVRASIQHHVSAGGRQPGLAVVLVGQDPASAIYVRNKRRAAEQAGILALDYDLPDDIEQRALTDLVETLNNDPAIDGILVQLPLPGQIDETAITNCIKSAKDVDGFHAFNVGKLALRQPGLRPCTPRGVMSLLHYYALDAKRRHAVVVGASNIVGRPMSLELLLAGATVTTCHKFTRDLERHVRAADLLVVAVGQPGIVNADWIKPGSIVIDIGINRRADGSLCGDLDFDQASQRAAWITPVPGGVGPMTVATLMQNTAEAAGVVVDF